MKNVTENGQIEKESKVRWSLRFRQLSRTYLSNEYINLTNEVERQKFEEAITRCMTKNDCMPWKKKVFSSPLSRKSISFHCIWLRILFKNKREEKKWAFVILPEKKRVMLIPNTPTSLHC